MSLVEKAIEKLRSAQTSQPSVPFGSVVNTVESPGLKAAGEPVDSGRMVTIDLAVLTETGFLPDASCARRLADQYRQIKRPVIARALSREPGAEVNRLIMVASALPGDGKSFTTINLALSIAGEKDLTVLLVDGDVAKPRVSQLLGVDREPGLLDVLADSSVKVESKILRTNVPGLFLLPAGRPRDGATELLSSARMIELCKILLSRDAKRIVIFDSSPLLVASESRPLIDAVGQVLLVVRAGSTPRQAVLDAATLIGGNKHVGLVLNQGQAPISETYYGYGTYGDQTPKAR